MATTAVIIPVLEAEPLLSPIRRLHTEDGPQGMPAHVTLLYPFTDSSLLDDARLDAVARIVSGFEAFAFSLGAPARFPENRRVLFLRPEPAGPFRALTAALVAAFPEHPPYGGKYDDPIPHATVAMGDEPLLATIERQLTGALPLAARATEATVVELADGAVWTARRRLPLSGG